MSETENEITVDSVRQKTLEAIDELIGDARDSAADNAVQYAQAARTLSGIYESLGPKESY